MRIEATSDLWWKNAIIYVLDVETFADGNGDGIGDFAGATERLDYLAGLGVSCVWLLPFYPSTHRDDGYDVTDYYSVDPAYGTLGDLVEFIRTATDRGIRLIADLLINHTSDQHPWFQQARRDRSSPYHDYYVWADEKPADDKDGIAFPGKESSTWTYDRVAKQWYLHHFREFQPDLNADNPEVIAELERVMGFWLQLGFSGFRLDAVPFFTGSGSGIGEQGAHEHLRRLRAFLNRRRGDAILLGEVNVEEKDLLPYFGGAGGDELTMLFNFTGMQSMWLSFVRGDSSPLVHTLRRMPDVDQPNQYAYFLRVHDELTLDKLTSQERDSVMAALAPEENMRLYGRGIRRRVPPMFNGDCRRIEMAYSLMFSLPGTPVLLYGEEIGMAEDLALPDRLSVRTPMQWAPIQSAGFSSAPENKLFRPVHADGPYGYRNVNVQDQRRDPQSLLTFFGHLIRARRDAPEVGWGTWSVIETDAPAVLAHRCDWQDCSLLAVHNLSDEDCALSLKIAIAGCQQEVVMADRDYPQLDPDSPSLKLSPYGYYWLRLRHPYGSDITAGERV